MKGLVVLMFCVCKEMVMTEVEYLVLFIVSICRISLTFSALRANMQLCNA